MADTKWTDGRKHSFIVGVLRAGARRYPPKYETLNEAKTEKKINPKTGRMAQHFRCASCSNEYPSKQVQVDHRDPVVSPVDGFVSWDIFIERLYCGKDNLQVLCLSCHQLKSKKERIVRKRINTKGEL